MHTVDFDLTSLKLMVQFKQQETGKRKRSERRRRRLENGSEVVFSNFKKIRQVET